MSLSQMQKSLIERARSVGDSEMAVPIGDAAGAYLLARLRFAPACPAERRGRSLGTSCRCERFPAGGKPLALPAEGGSRSARHAKSDLHRCIARSASRRWRSSINSGVHSSGAIFAICRVRA